MCAPLFPSACDPFKTFFKDFLAQSSEGMWVTGPSSLQPPSAAVIPKVRGTGLSHSLVHTHPGKSWPQLPSVLVSSGGSALASW